MAISTLRTKRSRPMRLTAVLAKQRAEGGVVERAPVGQLRRTQGLARGKLGLAAGLRELVPRTDGEAVVAAIDAVAHRRAQLARDRALVLDGEVGDAAPRIEPIGRGEGRGRADVEAGAAGAAMVRSRRVRRQVERGEDRAEKQPRAEFARHQVGVLALPAEAGGGGERLLHHGGGVDEHLDVAAGCLAISQRASALSRGLMTS